MRLSPESIQELAICPRRFQHLYVDQLTVPVLVEQQRQMSQSHRLRLRLQQAELGLLPSLIEPPSMELDDRALHQAVVRLIQSVPGLAAEPTSTYESDHSRTLPLHGHRLTVFYDWVTWSDPHAQILLWSTEAPPTDPAGLAQDWQTRLALFVLAETSSYAPEQILLTHWFVPLASPEASPIAHSVTYSAAQHQQTQAELIQLLGNLTHWLQQYDAGTPFPQTPDPAPCFACAFARRCQRGPFSPAEQPSLSELANLEAIAEVALESG